MIESAFAKGLYEEDIQQSQPWTKIRRARPQRSRRYDMPPGQMPTLTDGVSSRLGIDPFTVVLLEIEGASLVVGPYMRPLEQRLQFLIIQ
jgi:hypothetical protein